MKLKNKIFNLWYGVKRIKKRGSKNAGKLWNGREWVIVKFDWNKPFSYTTKTYDMSREVNWKKLRGKTVLTITEDKS